MWRVQECRQDFAQVSLLGRGLCFGCHQPQNFIFRQRGFPSASKVLLSPKEGGGLPESTTTRAHLWKQRKLKGMTTIHKTELTNRLAHKYKTRHVPLWQTPVVFSPIWSPLSFWGNGRRDFLWPEGARRDVACCSSARVCLLRLEAKKRSAHCLFFLSKKVTWRIEISNDEPPTVLLANSFWKLKQLTSENSRLFVSLHGACFLFLSGTTKRRMHCQRETWNFSVLILKYGA